MEDEDIADPQDIESEEIIADENIDIVDAEDEEDEDEDIVENIIIENIVEKVIQKFKIE